MRDEKADAEKKAINKHQEALERQQQTSKLLERLEKEKQQQTSKEKQTVELIMVMTELKAVAILPNVDEANNLAAAGKCKEARDLIKKGAQHKDQASRNSADIYQGMTATACDKNRLLAVQHYSVASQNGSHAAVFLLDNLLKEEK